MICIWYFQFAGGEKCYVSEKGTLLELVLFQYVLFTSMVTTSIVARRVKPSSVLDIFEDIFHKDLTLRFFSP